jgi:hypothetical protein
MTSPKLDNRHPFPPYAVAGEFIVGGPPDFLHLRGPIFWLG